MKLKRFLVMLLSLPIAVYAEISTDGSLGAVQHLQGQMTIPQNLGTTAGNNLFHSFQIFNVNSGESATFTGNNSLQNVISRVTGGQISTIDGLLKSEIPNANFYFINPAGVTFGANAQVDVPAAFHVSTANYLKFADGAQFSASNLNASTLTIAEPQSFGFLNNSSSLGNITIDGAQLSVLNGKTQDFVASNLTIKNHAKLNAPAGEIRLVALGKQNEVSVQKDTTGKTPLPDSHISTASGGILSMDSSEISSTGNGGGRVAFWGGTIEINNAVVNSSNNGAKDANFAKAIEIRAQSLSLANNTTISASAYGSGNSGMINLNADSIEILEKSSFTSNTYSNGNTGIIDVTAHSLLIKGGHKAGIYSNAMKDSTGNAATITLNIGLLNIRDGTIGSDTYAVGKAGNINITTDHLTTEGGTFAWISSAAEAGSGDAGDVIVNAGLIEMSCYSTINSDTYTAGKAGNVTITAKSLTMNVAGLDVIAISSSTLAEGNAGNVTVNADSIAISGSGISNLASSTYGKGDAGSVNVNADRISIAGQGGYLANGAPGVYSIANPAYPDYGVPLQSSGNAGTINIHSRVLEVKGGGIITSDTEGLGNAGNVNITSDYILIDGQTPTGDTLTKISSDALGESQGKGGVVNLQSKTLEIRNQGQISSYTYSPVQGVQGKAGDLFINASEKIALFKNGAINSSTYNNGYAGDVFVTAPVILLNNSTISAAAAEGSSGQIGNVNVSATEALQLTGNAKITIQNDATVANPVAIKARFISVFAPKITLKNSSIIAESTKNVDAGDINVKADALVMDNAAIQANAGTGKGGNLNLDLQALIPTQNQLLKGGAQVLWQPFISGFNVIQAASAKGVNGAVNVNSPQFNISGSVSGLDSAMLVLPTINHTLCEGSTTPTSSLIRASKGGIPDDGLELSFIAPMTVQNLSANAQKNLTPASLSVIALPIAEEKRPCAISSL